MYFSPIQPHVTRCYSNMNNLIQNDRHLYIACIMKQNVSIITHNYVLVLVGK